MDLSEQAREMRAEVADLREAVEEEFTVTASEKKLLLDMEALSKRVDALEAKRAEL